jgi:hypothetical protein
VELNNSKPLRWDEDGVVPEGALWGIEINTGDEAFARNLLREQIGEVDEQFIHVVPSSRDDGKSYLYVSRAETGG